MMGITSSESARESANAALEITPVDGALRRVPVPERAPRDTSLPGEVTPTDRGVHGCLLEKIRKDVTGSESTRESATVST